MTRRPPLHLYPRQAFRFRRYYFNLTDGDTMIRDQEGTEASSIQAAVLSAMEAVEELRAQDPSNSEEWRGWRLGLSMPQVKRSRQFRLTLSPLISLILREQRMKRF